MPEYCFAPSEIDFSGLLDRLPPYHRRKLTENNLLDAVQFASRIGRLIAEPLIFRDFIAFQKEHRNRSLLDYRLFLDIPVLFEGKIAQRADVFASWMWGVHQIELFQLSYYKTGRQSGKNYLTVPDIVIYDDQFGNSACEYYEIKPDSKTGRADGRKELRNLDSIFWEINGQLRTSSNYTGRNDIHTYSAGMDYPFGLTRHIDIATGRSSGRTFPVKLRVRRNTPGLLTYSFCVNAPTEALATLMLLRLLIRMLFGNPPNNPEAPDMQPAPPGGGGVPLPAPGGEDEEAYPDWILFGAAIGLTALTAAAVLVPFDGPAGEILIGSAAARAWARFLGPRVVNGILSHHGIRIPL